MREIKPLGSIDETINELIKYRDKGEKVYCIFNGHILHSENITFNSAYMMLYGKTQAEISEENKMEEYDAYKRAQDIKNKCLALIPNFIVRGKKVIFEDKYTEWEQFVKENIGMPSIIETALLIMEQLDNNFDLEATNKIMLERIDVIYPILVTKIVFKFSPYGAHFYQDYNCIINPEKHFYEWAMLEQVNQANIINGRKYNKKIPELIKGFVAEENQTLDDILDVLFAAQDQGIDMFAIYKGIKLYSRTVTTNDAYIKVYGLTKEEYKNNGVVLTLKRG